MFFHSNHILLGQIQTGFHQISLWLFNVAMENGPFMDDFPTKTSIYKGFSSSLC